MEMEEKRKGLNGHAVPFNMSQDDINLKAPSLNYDDSINCAPFSLLSGEKIQFTGTTFDGTIGLSNYRVFLHHNDVTHHIPLGVIETADCRELFYLYLLCKDAKSFKCTFSTNESCLEWQRRISKSISMPEIVEKTFAFGFFSSLLEENRDLHSALKGDCDLSYAAKANKMFDDEVRRMGYDVGAVWRISSVNSDYKFCSTYPRKLIVPSSISDKVLDSVATFRMSRRIPAVVWRHPNGPVIVRCSQPEVGWLGWRSAEDEGLVKAIAEACAYDSPAASFSSQCYCDTAESDGRSAGGRQPHTEELQNGVTEANCDSGNSSCSTGDIPSICNLPEARVQSDIKKVLIVDARSYATAVANRARGGGCECPEYYNTCEIQFMNLPNIHTVRKSHHALRQLVFAPSDIPNWLSLLENSRWLSHISLLIKSAVTIAQAIAIESRPVLVHCSDGWDRTPQLTALAQLILDPYYRTFQGFEVLVEKEWFEFGHKFSDRCGCGVGSEDVNERCPVFLQWLDGVYQLLRQFPTAFQFNQAFLVKLAQHAYSNLFGSFLANSSKGRSLAQLNCKTFSVWSLFKLQSHRYTNFLFVHTSQVLYPSFHTKDLELWKAVYIPESESPPPPPHSDDAAAAAAAASSSSQSQLPTKEDEVDEANGGSEIIKTKSCDNLVALSGVPAPLVRRLSDPNIRDSSPNMALLKSAIGAENFEGCGGPASNDVIFASSNGEFFREIENKLEVDSLDSSLDALDSSLDTLDSGLDALDSGDSSLKLLEESSNQGELATVCQDVSKRSIESSTDTLVAELGVIACDDRDRNPSATASASSASLKKTAESMNGLSLEAKESKLSKGSEETVSSSSASSYAKKLQQKRRCPPLVCENGNGIAEDKIDEKKYLSNGTCSTCLHQNRKFFDELVGAESLKAVGHLEGGGARGANGGRSSSLFSTPGHSRTPSSCIPSTPSEERYLFGNHERFLSNFTSSVDGLSNLKDDCNRRLHQILLQNQIRVDNLRRELQATKALNQLMHTKLHHFNHDYNAEDEMSLPESLGSGSAEGSVTQESGASDASWEAVEEGDRDLRPTLWVPDHAVDQCTGCHSQFWIGRRKHHCRSCGKIFCSECSDNSVPIPKENLYYPVRVCGSCFLSLFDAHKPQRYIAAASN